MGHCRNCLSDTATVIVVANGLSVTGYHQCLTCAGAPPLDIEPTQGRAPIRELSVKEQKQRWTVLRMQQEILKERGSVSRAAKALGTSRYTIYRYLRWDEEHQWQ